MAHMLIMDDDPEFSFQIRGVLESEGHSVEWSRSGAEAFERLKAEAFDLLICDIYVFKDGRLSDDGGISLIGRIRAKLSQYNETQLREDIPIIAISGRGTNRANPNVLRTADLVGANYTLEKPVSDEELSKTVNLVLRN